MAAKFGVFSTTRGSDGNGILNPYDSGSGGSSGEVNTADATVTTALSLTPVPSSVQEVEAIVIARQPQAAGDPTAGASYKLKGTFRTTGAGACTQIGAAGGILTEQEADAGLAAITGALDTDGTNIRVRVTGIAATDIRWSAFSPYSPRALGT